MNEQDTIDRDEVARKASNELNVLMRTHGLFIAARDFPNWRPTQRATGDIQGVFDEVTILATDGILAYFLDAVGNTFIGHIQKFSGKVKPLFSVPKQPKIHNDASEAQRKNRKPQRQNKRKAFLDSI